MFEHLSSKAQKAIKLANQIAKQFGQDYIDTEHILLGIMTEDTGRGAQELKAHGFTLDKLKSHIKELIKQQPHQDMVTGPLPAAPHLQNVIANAIEQARKLNHPTICTEHLLLALLKEKRSAAYVALQDLGADLPKLRRALSKQAAQHPCDEA